MADNGPACCTNDCCGPGSYCCARAKPHTHDTTAKEPDYVALAAAKALGASLIYYWDVEQCEACGSVWPGHRCHRYPSSVRGRK